MKIKNFGWRVLSAIKSHRLPLEVSQSRLAWDDSQNFIYKNLQKNTKLYSDQWSMRKSVFEMAPPSGELFEFGVFKAASTNFFAGLMRASQDQRILVGFDSFTGFSEDWTGVEKSFPKERFDLAGALPEVADNVRLIDGFIEESLTRYLENNNIENIAFVHIDTDTYSPAKTILALLKPFFVPGTVVLFDELLGYPNWRNHELRALDEELHRASYEYLGFAVSGPRANLVKAAIRIVQ